MAIHAILPATPPTPRVKGFSGYASPFVAISVVQAVARELVASVAEVTNACRNEQSLRHEIENLLETACKRLDITWTAYQLDRTLFTQGRSVRFVDAVHGAVVIEYEPPGCFRGQDGAKLAHARKQAEEYTELLAREEGRPLPEYVLVAWDGSSLSFGRYGDTRFIWEPPSPFDAATAERLLEALRDNGIPLVHPHLLVALAGPASATGDALLPAFFSALKHATAPGARTTKTQLLFVEWKRLFGQVVGITSDGLKKYIDDLRAVHGCDYSSDPAAYLFALNTYIALVAKLVAALAIRGAAEDITDSHTPLEERLQRLESGQLFLDAGISNMLNGDFFSWYRDDDAWVTFAGPITDIVGTLQRISFDVTRKDPQSTRDLFKGLYMLFAPRVLRHALGEFYTPDWLAAHALDEIGWQPTQTLLDPTCGTGTFVLEGLRRRLTTVRPDVDAGTLLKGLYGLDLNPLAVLAAKASLVVFLGQRLSPEAPVQLPIFLADAINPPNVLHGHYTHTLQTELGEKTFRLPSSVVEHSGYFALMNRVRELIDASLNPDNIMAAVSGEPPCLPLDDLATKLVFETVTTLVALHREGWNGIWCSILADRFAAAAVPRVDAVAGNPPWVKWSHLPPEYAEFIKPRCVSLGIFSNDSWVGGIESDISTLITYEALERYCSNGGMLVFIITGTVFANESSQGFRRWRLPNLPQPEHFTVVGVEDYAAIAPFEGVSNHPTLLVLCRNRTATKYPVRYKVWQPPKHEGRVKRQFVDATSFRSESTCVVLSAQPIPGSDAGPWLKGTGAQLAAWAHMFGKQDPIYRARKGITTDANGVFFVDATASLIPSCVRISNEPRLGRRMLARVRDAQVEAEHVFPLLRGRGVAPFRVTPDSQYCVLIPQRGMHGDPELPTNAPRTHRYLNRFHAVLEARSSYRRFQKCQPWWSLWSTGPYTFSPYKVVWQEMSGGRFGAAYVGTYDHPVVGTKVVVPDHKVYFIPVSTEDEAAFLTGFLNAPLITDAVAAYAAALSLGVSVAEYLLIPKFDIDNKQHKALSELAKRITNRGIGSSDQELVDLNVAVANILAIPKEVLAELLVVSKAEKKAAVIALDT